MDSVFNPSSFPLMQDKVSLPPIQSKRPLPATHSSPTAHPGLRDGDRVVVPARGNRQSVDLRYSDVRPDGWQAMDKLMDLKMDPAYPMQAYIQHFSHLCEHPHLPTVPSGFKLHLFLRGLTRTRRPSAEHYIQNHPEALWTDVADNLRELERAEAMIHHTITGDGPPPARPGALLIRGEPVRSAPEPVTLSLPSLSSSPSRPGSLPVGFAPAKPDLANLMGAGLNDNERDAVAGIVGLGLSI